MADAALSSMVETELIKARDVAESRSLTELREATGAGHDDLTEVLEELRVGGKVSEVTPGEYALLDTNAAAREEATAARNGHAAEVEEPPPMSLAEAERRAGASAPGRYPVRGGERKTTLTQGVASALDEQSLGKLVKAGMEEAGAANAVFIFEVLP